METIDLTQLVELCKQKSDINNWTGDVPWIRRGVYLHLEVSEFIEALRGKGNSTPEQEAADVLFVLFSLIGTYNIDIDMVLAKVHHLASHRHYT